MFSTWEAYVFHARRAQKFGMDKIAKILRTALSSARAPLKLLCGSVITELRSLMSFANGNLYLNKVRLTTRLFKSNTWCRLLLTRLYREIIRATRRVRPVV